MKLNFMNVTAKDIDRAEKFYRKLLQREPDSRSERLVTFEFDGIEFGIHYPEADGIDINSFRFGDNTVPAFEVENLEKELKRIREFAEVDTVEEADGHQWAIIKDSEGNFLEIYSS